ncbi:hypothetical protein [Epilithonimonas zeae]|uniref:hypothetical protein n=1 Tax=Epilithonimonas zeae TaxID=1416779 RepID=UPI0020103CF8|nr:hypothetical protein [Epilithonimonas zeae]UQB69746.1 hypothetical protein KI430_04765 [Epilithonimonas zeae]
MTDFFDSKCQQIPVDKNNFGLRDDEDGTPAYIIETNKDSWQAEVFNKNGYDIIFTAIDKCIIQDNEYKGRGRCEGMLTTKRHLYLVELKDKKNLSSGEMLDQLESTIKFLKEFHTEELKSFTHKKVFGCNSKKKGNFFVIDNEFQKSFKGEYGFRIDIQTNIVIV